MEIVVNSAIAPQLLDLLLGLGLNMGPNPENPSGARCNIQGAPRDWVGDAGGETVFNGFQKGNSIGRGAPIEETDGGRCGIRFHAQNHAGTCFDRILCCSFLSAILLLIYIWLCATQPVLNDVCHCWFHALLYVIIHLYTCLGFIVPFMTHQYLLYVRLGGRVVSFYINVLVIIVVYYMPSLGLVQINPLCDPMRPPSSTSQYIRIPITNALHSSSDPW